MNKKNKSFLFKTILLIGTLLGAHSAFADTLTLNQVSPCEYDTLVPNIINGTTNTSVCVDIPNKALAKQGNKIVWDIDTPVTTDGLPNTTPASLRHMWMMANAMEYMVQQVKNNTGADISSKIHIYGVIHGTALHWALNDDWWKAQLDDDGNPLYPNGNPEGAWIQKLQDFAKTTGLDIHLEVCGVTLMGNNLTNANVYPGILVNGGAFGRFAVLHNEGFLVIQEGWIDNDKRHHDHH
jgi:intracellular sulfur oxidation DsrE/DsrF family protein